MAASIIASANFKNDVDGEEKLFDGDQRVANVQFVIIIHFYYFILLMALTSNNVKTT